ncbi:MAG: hypothetical protein WC331_02155, partial [Candidatus Omnitrophota bacterium]|jgi:hypothetical protein
MPGMNEQVFNFPPIRLERVLSSVPPGGYHVPAAVSGVKNLSGIFMAFRYHMSPFSMYILQESYSTSTIKDNY